MFVAGIVVARVCVVFGAQGLCKRVVYTRINWRLITLSHLSASTTGCMLAFECGDQDGNGNCNMGYSLVHVQGANVETAESMDV